MDQNESRILKVSLAAGMSPETGRYVAAYTITGPDGTALKRFAGAVSADSVLRAEIEALLLAVTYIDREENASLEISSENPELISLLSGAQKVKNPLVKIPINRAIMGISRFNARFLLVSSANNVATRDLLKAFQANEHGIAGYDETEEVGSQVSAGGVVYKKEGSHFKVCVIAKHGKRIWALPKGRVLGDEKPEETARREVQEETGHVADVLEKIDEIEYSFFWKDNHTLYHKKVYFFLMPVVREGATQPDKEADAVRWMSIGDAYGILTYLNEKEVLEKARKILVI